MHADRRAEELEGLGCRLSGSAHAADRRMEGLAGLGGALDLAERAPLQRGEGDGGGQSGEAHINCLLLNKYNATVNIIFTPRAQRSGTCRS